MNSGKRAAKVRVRPRISAPKLGEYLDTRHASRREQIVHDQKFPADFIVARYKDAFNAIRSALVSGDDVGARLLERTQAVSVLPATTKYQKDTRRLCVEAINAFGVAWVGLVPQDVERLITGTVGFVVPVEGVDVIAHPVVRLRRALPGGGIEIGALQLIFHHKKDGALGETGGPAAAEIIRRALVAAGHENVVPSLCVVLDVFSGDAFQAPKHNRRLTATTASACREIAARWPVLESRKTG